MRAFAEAWPQEPFVQQVVAQTPWGHQVRLLDQVPDRRAREFYLRQAILHGWSRNILAMQIQGGLHRRLGKAVSNFSRTLPPQQSDLAQETLKDPYNFTSSRSPRPLVSATSSGACSWPRLLARAPASRSATEQQRSPMAPGDQPRETDAAVTPALSVAPLPHQRAARSGRPRPVPRLRFARPRRLAPFRGGSRFACAAMGGSAVARTLAAGDPTRRARSENELERLLPFDDESIAQECSRAGRRE